VHYNLNHPMEPHPVFPFLRVRAAIAAARDHIRGGRRRPPPPSGATAAVTSAQVGATLSPLR
jgi:hypothetical protein